MVLLPGCVCCGSPKCPFCPDLCSFTMQGFIPQVAQSGIFFGSSINQSCNVDTNSEVLKEHGICPGFIFTDATPVHNMCLFDNCDTECEQNGLGSAVINQEQKTLSSVQIDRIDNGLFDGGQIDFGVVAGIGSSGYANCTTDPEARLNSAQAIIGIDCKFIANEPSQDLQIFAQLIFVTKIHKRVASVATQVYFKQVTRFSTFTFDRVCVIEDENRRCDFLPNDAVRVAFPEGLLPMDVEVSSSGTSLGEWQSTVTSLGTNDTNDSSYSVGEDSFSCLEQSFVPKVRIGRRDCRNVNPLP